MVHERFDSSTAGSTRGAERVSYLGVNAALAGRAVLFGSALGIAFFAWFGSGGAWCRADLA
jgi:hypothetical protein